MAKRLKRPRDPISLAKLIGDIATGLAIYFNFVRIHQTLLPCCRPVNRTA